MVDSALDKSAPGPWSGWLHGLLGVIIFSGSLPATRLAVQDMDPFLLTFLRASIAGLLAIALLAGFRQKRPRASQLVPLAIVSSGVVIGFPLLALVSIGALVLTIIAGIKANEGQNYRYPFSWRLVK